MSTATGRRRAGSVQRALQNIESDPSHHLAGPFMPQTPPGSTTPVSNGLSKRTPVSSPSLRHQSGGLWSDLKNLRWMTAPASSFKLLMIPIILHLNWSLLNLHVFNPFAPLLFISYPIPHSTPADPRYAKGWLDFAFLAYHIIVFSFIRQFTILKIMRPIARHVGIKKETKINRFGEQGYAVLYYGVMGVWGMYIMSSLPTWWYRTEYFWIDYPHWEMKPAVKRYYLMQLSYWLQQLIVLGLKLEKPRKDFNELVAHHIITLWLIGWSYGINLTSIGNAVFISMDIPDTFLGLAKLFNYLQLERTNLVVFAVFTGMWTYFRHWLNLVMLWSVWNEFDLIPESANRFVPHDGVYMVWWMRYQIFLPILLLQLLNLFWYFLIWRIVFRAITAKLDDVRSDDEDDGNDEDDGKDD